MLGLGVGTLALVKGLMTVVPSIAGWIAGDDAEEKANEAIELAKQVTGIDDPQNAVDTLQQNPELAIKYQVALLEHQYKMAKLDLEDTKAHLKDTENARKHGENSLTDELLGLFISVMCLVLVVCVVMGYTKSADERLLMLIVGYCFSEFKQFTSYVFGTGKGAVQQASVFQDAIIKRVRR